MRIKWNIKDQHLLWLMALPGVLYFIIFKYIPMAGNVIAFQDYSIFIGIFNSPWVGFKHFYNMFTYYEFYQILRNNVLLNFYNILYGFPAPLILALMLNEVRQIKVKRSVQTLVYLPHFLSWVIVGGIFINLLEIDGFANRIVTWFGYAPIDFVTQSGYFRTIIITSSIWKEMGFGTILYLAALSAINPDLYEAAMVDGAGRWRRMWYITLPSLTPTIVVLMLLTISHVLETNIEQILVFLNPLVRDTGEVIDTYVYRVGLLSAQFSFTTAIGIFKSIVGLALVVGVNYFSRRTTGESIY